MDTEKHEFDKLSKAEWIEVIKQSLKEKSINDFKWKVAPDLQGEPFTHIEDVGKPAAPITGNRLTNNWKIGLDQSGQGSLPELKGIDAMVIDAKSAGALSESTYHSKSLVLSFENEDEFRHFDLTKIRAASCHILLKDPWTCDPQFIFDAVQAAKGGSTIGVEIGNNFDKGPVITGLASTFAVLVDWLHKIQYEKQQHLLFKQMRLIYRIKTADILFEISMIRAIKMLWLNLGEALFNEATDLEMDVVIHPGELTEESNHQLILGTVATMAAAIGGVNTVFFSLQAGEPAESIEKQRLFRNIQLILKHESNMAHVIDPVAGSYAIEDLTEKIASATWNRLVSVVDTELSR